MGERLKAGIRILSITTGPAVGKTTLLLGIVSRRSVIEGVLSCRVKVDGTDATDAIVKMLARSRFGEQVGIIAVNGIGLAGLNILDVKTLERRTATMVMSVTRARPHPGALIDALRAFSRDEGVDVKDRVALVEDIKALGVSRLHGFYAQTGIDRPDAEKFIDEAATQLRLAHMVARGVSSGESKGRL